MKDDLKNFTANDARNISKALDDKELEELLHDIKRAAEGKGRGLFIYNTISFETRKELIKRGFAIEDMPSIAIQKDGIHHTIYW